MDFFASLFIITFIIVVAYLVFNKLYTISHRQEISDRQFLGILCADI